MSKSKCTPCNGSGWAGGQGPPLDHSIVDVFDTCSSCGGSGYVERITAEEMTTRLLVHADLLVSLATRIRSRVGDGGKILGWRGMQTDLDVIAEQVEAIRNELRRGCT